MPHGYTAYQLQALAGIDYTMLASSVATKWFLDFVPNSNDIQGTAIAGAITDYTNTNSILSIPYTSPSAGMSNVPANATVWVGLTPGGNELGVYRTRAASSASPLSVMQISVGDYGLLTSLNAGSGSITTGSYITVRKSLNLWQAFPRIVVSGSPPVGTFYKDFDTAWNGQTISSRPIVNIRIKDVNGFTPGSHVSVFFDPNKLYATLSFDIIVLTWPYTDVTQTTYTWTLPAGATLVSGSLTGTAVPYSGSAVGQANITVRFLPGWQTIKLTVVATPSGVGDFPGAPCTTTCIRNIWVHDGSPFAPGTLLPPIQIGAITNDSRDRTGRTMEVQLLTQDAANLTDGTMVNLFCVPYFGGGGNVPSLIRNIPGWITMTKNQVDQDGLLSANITIENPGRLMGRIMAKSQRIDTANTPADWQHVHFGMATVDYFLWYLLAYHEPNYLTLFNFWPWYNPISNPNNGVGITANAGNEMGQLQEVAWKGAMQVGTDSAGDMWVAPHPSMMAPTDRSSLLVARAALSNSIFSRIDWQRIWQQPVGGVQAEGFQFPGTIDPVTGQAVPTPLLARAPGDQTGQGIGEQRLESQIVDSGGTLVTLCAQYYHMLNNPYPVLNLEIPSFFDVLEPAQQQIFSLTLPATQDPANKGLSWPGFSYGGWVPKVVSLQTEGGLVTTRIEAEYQTGGDTALLVPVPSPLAIGPVNPPPIITPSPGPQCFFFDFSISNGGWVVCPLGSGLTMTYNAPPTGTWYGLNFKAFGIKCPGNCHVTHISILSTVGGLNCVRGFDVYTARYPTDATPVNVPPRMGCTGGGAFNEEFSTGFDLAAGYYLVLSETSGISVGDTITGVRVTTSGANPFGPSNC